MLSDSAPLKVIKPTLIPWVVFVKYLPMQFNFIAAGASLAALIAFFLDLIFGFNFSVTHTFLSFLVILLFAIPSTLYYIFRKTYQLMEYRFYPDRLEYADGFVTIEYKQIMYSNITKISLRKNVIQRFYNLGSLYFAVPSASAGILLVDVPNPEAVYKEVQNIISSAGKQ